MLPFFESVASGFDLLPWLIALILAVVVCLFGYRLMRVFIFIAGFFVGFSLGYYILTMIFDPTKDQPIIFFVSFAIGIALGFVAFLIYKVGIFALGGLGAAAAVYFLPLGSGQVWDIVKLALAVVALVVAGILAVKFERPVLILVTAIAGAFAAVYAFVNMFPSLIEGLGLQILVGVVLAAIGVLVQFLMTRQLAAKEEMKKLKKERKVKEAEKKKAEKKAETAEKESEKKVEEAEKKAAEAEAKAAEAEKKAGKESLEAAIDQAIEENKK